MVAFNSPTFLRCFSLSPHGVLYVFIIRNLTENVNMNHNEEVPDFLGGPGDMSRRGQDNLWQNLESERAADPPVHGSQDRRPESDFNYFADQNKEFVVRRRTTRYDECYPPMTGRYFRMSAALFRAIDHKNNAIYPRNLVFSATIINFAVGQ